MKKSTFIMTVIGWSVVGSIAVYFGLRHKTKISNGDGETDMEPNDDTSNEAVVDSNDDVTEA